MSAEFLEEAENIAGFLMNYLTDGGIEDPEDGCVLPHSYTTEFFAWLCALLYAHGFGDEWLEKHNEIAFVYPPYAGRPCKIDMSMRPVSVSDGPIW